MEVKYINLVIRDEFISEIVNHSSTLINLYNLHHCWDTRGDRLVISIYLGDFELLGNELGRLGMGNLLLELVRGRPVG